MEGLGRVVIGSAVGGLLGAASLLQRGCLIDILFASKRHPNL